MGRPGGGEGQLGQVAGQGGGRFKLGAQEIGGILSRVLVDLADEGEVQRP